MDWLLDICLGYSTPLVKLLKINRGQPIQSNITIENSKINTDLQQNLLKNSNYSFFSTMYLNTITIKSLYFFNRLIIKKQIFQIKLKSYLINHQINCLMKSKTFHQFIIRLLNKINTIQSNMYFFVYLQEGCLNAQSTTIYTHNSFQQITRSHQNLMKFLARQVQSLHKYYQKHIIKILQGLGLTSEIYLERAGWMTRVTNQKLQRNKIVNIVKNQIIISKKIFQFQNQQLNNRKVLQLEEIIIKQKNINQLYKEISLFCKSSIFKNIYLYFNQDFPTFIPLTQQQMRIEFTKFIKYITPIALKMNTNTIDRITLYDQIAFKEKHYIKWAVLHQGSHFTLFKGLVHFSYSIYNSFFLDPDNNIQKKWLIKKEPKNESSRKLIQKQKLILNHLRKFSCIHITKYYQNLQYPKNLFTDCYNQSSLNNYIHRNQITCTWFSKIYILNQIAQGLNFLKSHNIVHCDLKLSNILIGKNLLIRINNFGNAQFISNRNESNLIAQTRKLNVMDYVVTQKSDIIGYGILMHELLFGFSLNLDQICNEKLLKQNNKKIIQFIHKNVINPDKSGQYCKKELTHQLIELIFKCLSLNHQQRPTSSRLAILMRLIITYLDKYY